MRHIWLVVFLAAASCSTSTTPPPAALPAIVELPASGAFGNVAVGSTSTQILTISPASGLQNDTITAVGIVGTCPDFTVTASGLPAMVFTECDGDTGGQGYGCSGFVSQSYSFTVGFAPATEGDASCVVQLTIDGGTRTIPVTGTGVEPPIDAQIAPSNTFDFGTVRVGKSATTPFVIRNAGTGTMILTSATVTAGGSNFTIDGPAIAGTQIGAGSSATDTISCSPTDTVPYQGAVAVVTNDPAKPNLALALACTGIQSSVEVNNDQPITLPATRVGDTTTMSVTILADTLPLDISSATVTGDGLSVSAPGQTSLDAGDSTTVTLTWTPTQGSADVDGGLTITPGSGEGSARTVGVHGAALPVHMSVTPDGGVDFGPVCAGHQVTKQFSVGADQAGGFTLVHVETTTPFAIGDGAGSAVALPVDIAGGVGSAIAFAVTASPTAGIESSATLELDTDIAGSGAVHDVTMFVTGLVDGVTPTPTVLNFGTPLVGLTVSKSVTLTNCTGSDLALGSAAITDDDAGEFHLTAEPTARTVPDGGSATYTVEMAPTVNGVKLASLVLIYADGSAAVPLAGTATGGSDAATGPASYYGCAIGGDGDTGGASAILIALAASRPRRRRR